VSGVDVLISRPRCDWHACPNTATVERQTTYKVKGENVYRARTVKFCAAHDALAARTGRMTLRDHPDALDNPGF